MVLADIQKLTEAWASIEADDMRQLRGVNRSYLVHPVSVGGAFHPKTVFLANAKEGVLMVGSGNLGLRGMEWGNEVFARYESRADADRGSFGVWRSWMAHIVDHAANPLLSSRWADLLGRAPWLASATGAGSFVTNWDQPLMDQLVTLGTEPAEALWVTAPFFDRDLTAFRELLRRTSPREVTLFLGAETSVDGRRVQALLRETDATVTIRTYEPRDYVHAKLVAIFRGPIARLLSGSANLSAPALVRAVIGGGHVNAEAGSLVDLPTEVARAFFLPPGHESRIASDDLLLDLQFRRDPTATATSIQLLAAVRQGDGGVTISATPAPDEAFLTDGANRAPIVGTRTDGKWPALDGPALVWLQRAGDTLSNRVPLADANALAYALNERATPVERPADLDAIDAQHPIGRLLADLHQTALFDPAEHHATKQIEQRESENPEMDHEFWARLLREQLGQDPRMDRYRRRSTAAPLADELSWLLDQMLARAPAANHVRLLSGKELDRETAEKEGQTWTTERRLAVRAFNVLERWSRAVADPRVRWASDLAPVRHYEMLLSAFSQIRAQQEDWIPEHRQTRLLETLLGAFVRSERAAGYLARLTDEERGEALLALVAGPGPGLAAGLAYVALRVATPATFFDWQPFLVAGLAWGAIAATSRSAELVASVSPMRPEPAEIQKRLEQVATYIDDEHWCARLAATLGFGRITLTASGNKFYPVGVEAAGLDELLTDPRIVTLAREVLIYRREPGLRMTAGSDVLAIAIARPLYGRVGGREIDTLEPITLDKLSDLESAGHCLGNLLALDRKEVS